MSSGLGVMCQAMWGLSKAVTNVRAAHLVSVALLPLAVTPHKKGFDPACRHAAQGVAGCLLYTPPE